MKRKKKLKMKGCGGRIFMGQGRESDELCVLIFSNFKVFIKIGFERKINFP